MQKNLDKKEMNGNMKKTLMIIGGIVVGAIILFVVIFFIISGTSKKLVCKSDEGNITIMYNDKTLKGYTAKNMSYKFDEQKEYAEQIGVDAYLEEFSLWFSNNTTGSCTK